MNWLGKMVGASEMVRNGGLWRDRIREDPGAMQEAMGQLKLNLPKVRKPAAWLTKVYRNERKRRGKGLASKIGHEKESQHQGNAR
jgi:hypothetical protein